jgi:uncharacterized protein YifE (UPF0438 family)
MKEAEMRIRVEPELRQAFVSVCRGQDLPAAQVLHGFVKEYMRKCQGSKRAMPITAKIESEKALSQTAKPEAKAASKAPRQPN